MRCRHLRSSRIAGSSYGIRSEIILEFRVWQIPDLCGAWVSEKPMAVPNPAVATQIMSNPLFA